MAFINILFAIAAAVLLLGIIGERDERRHQNITIAFVALCILIFAVNKLL